MMNPIGKDGKALIKRGDPLWKHPGWHKVDGLPSFDEIAAGGTNSSVTSHSWTTRTKSEQAEYNARLAEAKSFIEARKRDPDHEPEAVGDPSREWIRRLAKSDPDRCRIILEDINALPKAEQRPALQAAYTKFYYYEREGAAS